MLAKCQTACSHKGYLHSPSLLTPSHPKLYSTMAHVTVLETHQASCPTSLCTPHQGTLTRVILKGTNSHFSHSQFPRPLRAPELVDTLMSQYQPLQYTIPICIGPGLLHLSLGCSPSLVPSPVLDHKSTCSLCKTPQNALTSAPAITWSCPPPQPHHPIFPVTPCHTTQPSQPHVAGAN